jgi:hypothetical protein
VKIIAWIDSFTAWLEKDIRRMDARSDADWALTDLGRVGVRRSEVGWWRRKLELFRAAKAGRYRRQ